MTSVQRWCRVVVLGPGGDEMATWTVSGPRNPDLVVVDGLCLLRLAALRAGATAVLRDVSPALADLLALAGLGDQPEGEPEHREDALGVEEAVVLPDPSV